MHKFNEAKLSIMKTKAELLNDIAEIDQHIVVLRNRRRQIVENERLINKLVPMTKHLYSREYLKRIVLTFPQLNTPTDLTTALHMIRGLSIAETAKEACIGVSTSKRRRGLVLAKAGFLNHDQLCAYFVQKNEDIIK